jgi:hypothetical protein
MGAGAWAGPARRRAEGRWLSRRRHRWRLLRLPRKAGSAGRPPYGADRGGRLAEAFIRHALTFDVRLVAGLLRVDFDSAKTRADLFRDNKIFAGKIVLVDRIKWFKGPSQPSDNHAWFLWDRKHRGWPSIAYAGKRDADKAA